MKTVWQDLRYGIRMLAKSPGFTAVAVLSLALGIGANTAVFTLVDALLLKTLPVKDPEQLVLFGSGIEPGTSVTDAPMVERFSYPIYQDFRANATVFSGLAAFCSFDSTVYVRDPQAGTVGPPEAAQARLVSGNYFQTLGVPALIGRTLQPSDDETPGAHPVVVLSYAYWQQKLAGDPEQLGRTLLVQGQPYEIVGVASPEFFGEKVGTRPSLWLPLAMQKEVTRLRLMLEDRNTSFLFLLGRRQEGVSLQQAETEVNLLFQRILLDLAGSEVTEERRNWITSARIELTPASRGLSHLRRQFWRPLLLLMGVVGLVLLIACANVANLLLARATARHKEIGVRLALGAGRVRLIRHLLTESLLLGAAGGACGLLLARWASDALLVMVGHGSIPLDVDLDARVLTFTAGIALSTALLFGLVPALRATRVDVRSTLQGDARGTVTSGPRFSLGKSLVVAQVAVSLVLLIGAGLFVRTLANLREVELGFDVEQVVQVTIDPRGAGYAEDQLTPLYRRLRERLEAIPGVQSASLSATPLLGTSYHSQSVSVPGYSFQRGEDEGVGINTVTPGYFETVGMGLVAGRGLTSGDRKGAQRVTVINEAFARRFFPESSPLGAQISFVDEDKRNLEIVGVVRDAKYRSVRGDPSEMAFLSVYQFPDHVQRIAVRAAVDTAVLIPPLRDALRDVDRNLPVRSVVPMTQQLDEALTRERLLSKVTGFFGLLALLLASIGLYGVMSYAVSQRTSEIGIRMALGAQQRSVLWMVLRETLGLVGIGAAAGVLAALGAARLVASWLFGLTAADPATIAVAVIVLLAVTGLAGCLPARRAARVDPMVALRYE